MFATKAQRPSASPRGFCYPTIPFSLRTARSMFAGTYTALVTPFQNDRVDEAAFARLIEGQIAAGITGIVPVGTTGESATLDQAEHSRVIELGVKAAAGRCKV